MDLGNTRIKYAVFEGDRLEKSGVWEGERKKFMELAQTWRLKNAIISAVAGEEGKWAEDLRKILSGRVLILDENTPLPIENKYATPASLGKDRLACAVGAAAMFPSEAVLVVDAGTCIKYDFVDAKGAYWGGAISLGLRMRYRALHQYTERLPLLLPKEAGESVDFIGDSTANSIHSGVEWGLRCEVMGVLGMYRLQTGREDMAVIFTGGDAGLLDILRDNRIFAEPHLLMRGLLQILLHNV